MPNSFCDQNEGTVGLAFAWILLSIGVLTVSSRIYVRSGANRKIGWDDYAAVASLVSLPSFSALCVHLYHDTISTLKST